MEIGTGIFLGCVFIGLVVLYGYTKDRWRWKRIAAWFGGVVLVVAAGIGGWIGYLHYSEPDVGKPEVLSQFWGLKLGLPESEVKFRKGEPTKADGTIWVYDGGTTDPTYVVGFREGRVRFVVAHSSSPYQLPSVSGVSTYANQEELERRLGLPTYVSVGKGGLKRILNFEKYNLMVGLEKNQINAVGMYDASDKPLQFAEEEGESKK